MDTKKILAAVVVVAAIVGAGVTFGMKGSLFVDKRLVAMREASNGSNLKNDLQKTTNKEEPIACDVLIVGGGAGGTSAAISAAREGANTCLVEETDWLGGMVTSAGVAAIDGRPDTPSGIFKEMIDRVEAYYKSIGQVDKIHNCNVSYLCFEPSIGNKILKEMAAGEKNLRVFYNSKVSKVYSDANKILGVKFSENNNKDYIANAAITIDATEFGDLMYSANIPYDLGLDKNSTESLAKDVDQCIQPLTYVAILKKQSTPATLEKPSNYDREKYRCVIKSALCPDSISRFGMDRLLSYGRMPNDKLMINIPSHSYGNDFHATTDNLESFSRDQILEEAKNYSKGLIYFLQTELGFEYFDIHNEFGTADKFAKIPYVRESRRLQGVKRLTQDDIVNGDGAKRSQVNQDAIAIGDYPIDLHFCQYGIGDVFKEIAPYQIPYGVMVPKDVNGFMAIEKNISVSHIVNGTTRLQPVIMSVGQAAGIASAIASKAGVEPRYVNINEVQKKLLAAKSNLFFFKDLSPKDEAYKYAASLAIKQLLSGYSDFSFKPNNPINQADFNKLLNNFALLKNQDTSILSKIGLEADSNAAVKKSAAINYIKNLAKAKNSTADFSFLNSYNTNGYLTRGEALIIIGKTFDLLH